MENIKTVPKKIKIIFKKVKNGLRVKNASFWTEYRLRFGSKLTQNHSKT
jgi:hypothetical protein